MMVVRVRAGHICVVNTAFLQRSIPEGGEGMMMVVRVPVGHMCYRRPG